MLKLFCMSLQICFLISLVKHLKMTLYDTLNKTLNVFSRGNYTSTTIFATIESSHVCEYGQFTVEQREFEIEQTASAEFTANKNSMKGTDSKCSGHF